MSQPNTSFAGEGSDRFDPIGRFRTRMTGEELAQIEALIGDTLEELGYARAAGASRVPVGLGMKGRLYDGYLTTKLWARDHTPLGRRTSLEALYQW